MALLVVFVFVNASLLKLRLATDAIEEGYRIPLNIRNIPITAVGGLGTSLALILFYLWQVSG